MDNYCIFKKQIQLKVCFWATTEFRGDWCTHKELYWDMELVFQLKEIIKELNYVKGTKQDNEYQKRIDKLKLG